MATMSQAPASTSLDTGPPHLLSLSHPLGGPSPQVRGDADQGTDEEVQSKDGGDQPAGGCREHRLPQALPPATKHCEYILWGGALVGGLVGVWPGWEWPCRQALGARGGVSPPLPHEPGQEPVADRLGVDSPPQTNDHALSVSCHTPFSGQWGRSVTHLVVLLLFKPRPLLTWAPP